MEHFRVQTAHTEESAIVKVILDKASTIPAAKDIEQWPESFDIAQVIENIEAQGVFLFYDTEGHPIGTVDCRYEDPEIWGMEEQGAIYIHRLAIDPMLSGQGWGRKIVEWVIEKAKSEGENSVRLDCVTLNSDLRMYYEAIGFKHIRDIEWSGGKTSLYELST